MARYLSIVTKQSFFSLFKFGYIPQFDKDLIPYSKDDKDLSSALLEHFSNYAQVEFEEDYLIILWNKEIEKEKVVFELQDAERIIPLTRQAKISFTRKMGGKIHFSEPIFEDVYQKLEVQNSEANALRGSKVLWELLELPSNFQELYTKADLRNALELRISGKQSFELQASDFITHLFLYEGYEKFPRYCALGFVYDIIKILTDWKGITLKGGEKAYRKSGSFQYLEANREHLEKLNSLGLLKIIEKSEEEALKKLKDNLTVDGLKYWVLAFFFLNFKEDLREANSISETKLLAKIKHVINDKTYLPELEYAVSLLGYFFGFTKFYDDYYKHLNLYILTGKKEQVNKASVVQKPKSKLNAPNKLENKKEKAPSSPVAIMKGKPKSSKLVKHDVLKEGSVPIEKLVDKPISAEPVEVYAENAKAKSESVQEPINEREVVFTISKSQDDSKRELKISEESEYPRVLDSNEQTVSEDGVKMTIVDSEKVEGQAVSIQNQDGNISQKDVDFTSFSQIGVDNSLKAINENVSDNEQTILASKVAPVTNESQTQHPEVKSLELHEAFDRADDNSDSIQDRANNLEEQKDILSKENEIGKARVFSENEEDTLKNDTQQQLVFNLLDSKDKESVE